MLCELGQAICVLLLPFVTKTLIDALLSVPDGNASEIWAVTHMPLLHFILINIGLLILARASGTVLLLLAPTLRIKPRRRMLRHLQNQALNFFQSGFSGELGAKINTATVSMGHAMWVILFDLWPILIKFVATSALMFLSHPTLGFILIGWSILYISVSIYIGLQLGKASELVAHERAKITGTLVDVATNIQAVKSFANEDFEEKTQDYEMKDEAKSILIFNIWREANGWFHSVMMLGILSYSMYLSITFYADGGLSIGDIAFVLTLVLLLTEQTSRLGFTISHYLELYGQMADGVRSLFKPLTLVDNQGSQKLNVSKGDIAFQNLNFQYDEDLSKTVFQGLSLHLTPGQKIGLIGPSGAGKTSLINLLLRFYDIQDGTITIDGQDITQVTQRSLRQNIAVIPQDTALFHRSLMENIRYGRLDASDEEVLEAAKRAHAHEFISALPDGYDTMVGERGVKLSGGQRQRIAIARAILKDAPILILDEATSALDSESEKLIQESLQDLMKGKTVIAIAHRLSTIAHLDRLIVMDKGQIVEDGTHQNLLKQDGLYKKLWTMQSGGFLGE